jgi:ribose-phosphate pyrophosphokinase
MKLYNNAGEIEFRKFTFPDGQPHVEIQSRPDVNQPVIIETAIRNPEELFNVLLTSDALQSVGCYTQHLDIRYLMGARMDRRIGSGHALTLSVVAKVLLQRFKKIRVLDPHSSATNALLGATSVYPLNVLRTVLRLYSPNNTYVVAPDAGSTHRVTKLLKADRREFDILQGAKKRDPETGEIAGFEILNTRALNKHWDVLILDDICDGGRTFTGIAEVLHALGFKNVDLFVTHGVFSKSVPLKGIRHLITTDSYVDITKRPDLNSPFIWVTNVRMRDEV